eukprot:GFUD01039832.1.p1 GENE.GFUD01039832.1~~GFUD01039832.1.p1  ORF type:complete len:603 (+),score=176.77 GFUD01039832.1:64-1872(+)
MFTTTDPHTPSPRRPLPISSTPMMTTPVNPPPKASSQSCLPRPLFQEEPETFSTKKEKRVGGLFRPPPRPPAKSCPPKSRVFRHSNLLKAQAVSFNDTSDKHTLTGTPLHSAVYDTKKDQSYFQQAFIIEAEVGAGYFGTVYRVRSREDSQLYAVKIAREVYRGPSDRARKLEEVRKHQFLPPHSNLVRFYHSWEEKARLYQQFELCKVSLQEMGQQGRLDEDTIWGYMVDLLLAVQHLHEHDLVHMDIKPENIFIGMDGICKLGDFGLVIDLATGGDDGIEGDSCYLAPEVLSGRYTKACDLFSLGVTLLELATDMDLPRGGQLWHDLRNRGPDPSITMHLQPELRRVVQLMMTRDPDRRPGVKQLLELPCIIRAVRRRSRQLMVSKVREMALRMVLMFVPLVTFVLALLESIVHPLRQLVAPNPPGTPPPPSLPAPQYLPDCFSDDDDDCTVSSGGSSLAAPLQSSTSSDQSHVSQSHMSPCAPHDLTTHTSTPHSYYFSPTDPISTSHSPLKRPLTSPGPRSRGRFLARTPGSKCKVSPGKRLFWGDVGDGRGVGDSPVVTPATDSVQGKEDDEDSDVELVTMKPQSLAATFDYFSDDD